MYVQCTVRYLCTNYLCFNFYNRKLFTLSLYCIRNLNMHSVTFYRGKIVPLGKHVQFVHVLYFKIWALFAVHICTVFLHSSEQGPNIVIKKEATSHQTWLFYTALPNTIFIFLICNKHRAISVNMPPKQRRHWIILASFSSVDISRVKKYDQIDLFLHLS